MRRYHSVVWKGLSKDLGPGARTAKQHDGIQGCGHCAPFRVRRNAVTEDTSDEKEEDGEIVSIKMKPLERGAYPGKLRPICRRTGSDIEPDSGASWRVERSSRQTSPSLSAAPRRDPVWQAQTSPIPPHAAGTGTASRGRHILAPSVEEIWPTSG